MPTPNRQNSHAIPGSIDITLLIGRAQNAANLSYPPLCGLGYGRSNGERKLDLVYNPVGAFLPPAQAELEGIYRKELLHNFGIEFDNLLMITNMPIKRFAHELLREGEYEAYLSLLVDHRGHLYDCDFNQALDLPIFSTQTETIFDVEDLDALTNQRIETAAHCLGCTAGAGSSCGGTLS